MEEALLSTCDAKFVPATVMRVILFLRVIDVCTASSLVSLPVKRRKSDVNSEYNTRRMTVMSFAVTLCGQRC